MIEYFPSKIIVTNYEEHEARKIENWLSVWDKNLFRYTFKAFTYDEENKIMTFPGGISHYHLEQALEDHEVIDYSRKYLKEARKNQIINLLYQPRNDLQKKAIQFLSGNSFSAKSQQKLLCLNTGDGKTYVSINYISTRRKVPIIFVDLETLSQQWKNSILKFTDTKEEEIYTISGIDSIRNLLKMSDEEVYKYKFFIAIYKTIHMSMTKGLFEELFNKVGFTTKIYDEAHTNYENIFRIDTNTNCESIYLTATPQRSDPIENKVFQNMFYDVKRFTSNTVKTKEEQEEEKYHNIVVVKINSNPRIDDQEDCQNKYGFDGIKYSKYILERKYDYFYEKIISNVLFDIILKNGKKKRKTAILFGLKSMIAKFSEDLVKDLEERNLNGYSIGLLTEDTKKEEKQNALNSDIIITTDKSFGKGIDTSDLECVINFVPSSSKPKNIQIIGRLRKLPDKEVYYFDVNDIGFNQIKKQLMNKQRFFKEKAKQILTVEL